MHLHQRRLAGAVLAEHGVDLAVLRSSGRRRRWRRASPNRLVMPRASSERGVDGRHGDLLREHADDGLPRTRSSTTAIESPRCWLNAASARSMSPASTRSTMSRCSAIVASMRSADRKSCIRTRRMRSLTWRRKSTSDVVAGGRGQRRRGTTRRAARSSGSGSGASPCGERPPLVAQRLEDGRVVARAEPGRALQGLQLEPGAHLVEVAHHGDVGDDRAGSRRRDARPTRPSACRRFSASRTGVRDTSSSRPGAPRRGGR